MTFDYNGCMSNIRLSPEQWARMLDFLRGRTGLYVGQEADCRRFVEAVPPVVAGGRLYGLTALGPNGDCCQPNTGTGTASTNDSPVGLTKASGHKCINIAATTRIWNT